MKLQWVAGVILAFMGSANFGWTQNWINASGGSWQDANNWSGSTVPGVNAGVEFNLNHSYGVSLQQSIQLDYLRTEDRISINLNGNGIESLVEARGQAFPGGEKGVLNLSGGHVLGTAYANAGRIVFDGFTTTYQGNFNISSFGEVIFSGGASGNGTLGSIGNQGRFIADGAGTTVTSTNTGLAMQMGSKLQVSNGAMMEIRNIGVYQEGDVIVSGAGSKLKMTGGWTNTEVTVADGGRLEITSDFFLDGDAFLKVTSGGQAKIQQLRDSSEALGVLVTGSGSQLAVTDTVYSVDTSLTVADGATFSSERVLAYLGNNDLEVEGGGKLDANGGVLELGERTLIIQDGGEALIQNNSRIEARGIFNLGKLKIDSGTEIIESGVIPSFRNGVSGELKGSFTADMELENLGTIIIGSGEKIGFLDDTIYETSNNEGRIEINGGTFELKHTLENPRGGGILVEDGALQFNKLENDTDDGLQFFGTSYFEGQTLENQLDGEMVIYTGITSIFGDLQNDGDIAVADDAALKIYGDLSGSGNFLGTGTVEILGDLLPGNSPGSLSFAGDVVLGEDTNLVLEIGGTDPSDYDFLDIAGTLYADGTITFAFIDGYVPEDGDTLELIEFANFVGDFDQINFLGLTQDQIDNLLETVGGGVLSLVAVPEPSGGSLLLAGLGAWLWRRRKMS